MKSPGRVKNSEPFCTKMPEIDGTGGAGGLPEAHHHAERAQAIERLHERVPTDAVIDDRDFRAVGDLLHAIDEILPRRDDRIIAAMRFGELGLLVAADRADHGRA